MHQTHTLKEKCKLLFSILLPILITELATYAMNFIDTVMSGQAGTDQLAGVAIGSSLWVPIFTGLTGIILGLTPIISQLIGAGHADRVAYPLLQAIYLSIVIGLIVIGLGTIFLEPILQGLNVTPSVQSIATGYLATLAAGILPLFTYTAIRCFIDALGQTRVTMIMTLVSLPVNAVLNYMFIFGHFGAPALGGVGAGAASALTYWLIMIIALYIVIRVEPFRDYQVFAKLYRVSIKAWSDHLKLGLPIGFSIFFETSIFSAVTFFMSDYSTVVLAAHQAAINFESFLYMPPFSISMALTIAVGFEVGAGRHRDAIHYSYLGMGAAVLLAVIFSGLLYLFNDSVARIYSPNPEVIAMTAHFLIYAIFFQLSDAIAAPLQGALRGYKDVNMTFVVALISYWLIGLPSGYLIAHYTQFGPFGYWIGLSIGLTAGAVCLFIRLLVLQTRHRMPQSS